MEKLDSASKPENKNQLLQIISSFSRNELIDLSGLVKKRIKSLCPECRIGIVEVHDGERVCSNCGLVFSQVMLIPNRIPGVGSDNSYNPSSNLVLGKNGSIVGRGKVRDYIQVAKNNGHDERELPLAAMRLHNLEHSLLEHPFVAKMILYVCELSKNYGYGSNEVFGDGLGKIVRKVASFLELNGQTRYAEYFAKLCFAYYLLRIKTFNEKDQRKLFEELPIQESHLGCIERLLTKSDLTELMSIKV